METDIQEEDIYPPEDYIRPGCESFLYVNAYSITRHFGGREEGGWYYDSFFPLASIPVRAISLEGHDNSCWTCSQARNGVEGYKLCEWGFQLQVIDEDQLKVFKDHLHDLFDGLQDGDRFSVLGGTDICVCVEDRVAEISPKEIPRYE